MNAYNSFSALTDYEDKMIILCRFPNENTFSHMKKIIKSELLYNQDRKVTIFFLSYVTTFWRNLLICFSYKWWRCSKHDFVVFL